MADDIASKHLRTSVELTLLADIKPGFVPIEEQQISYASRLAILLSAFFLLRKAITEQRPIPIAGPLEELRSLHFFRWAVVDGGSKLLLAVTFDRPWEPYIRSIVDRAGPFLDVIFCHCTDYEKHSTDRGYQAFATWVRKKQIDVPFFYAAEPDRTIDDLRYLREFERRHVEKLGALEALKLTAYFKAYRPMARAFEWLGVPLERLGLPPPRPSARSRDLGDFDRDVAQMSLGRLGEDDIPPPTPLEVSEGLKQNVRVVTSSLLRLRPQFRNGDERFFDMAIWQVFGVPLGRAGELGARLLTELMSEFPELEAIRKVATSSGRPRPLSRGRQVDDYQNDAQGNILAGYRHMARGGLVLLRFDGRPAGLTFLRRILPLVTRHSDAKDTECGINVALTFNGLRTLGLSEPELAAFPKEFREGMEARAGLLGDVDVEHPSRWTEPLLNVPDGAGGEVVRLASVDLLLTVQKRGPLQSETFASFKDALPDLLKDALAAPGVHALHFQPLRREFWPGPPAFVKEHFGFRDGISQPVAQSASDATSPGPNEITLGEILLGYDNDHGEPYPPVNGGVEPLDQSVRDLVNNGSFLVVRKLEQHVGHLRAFVQKNALAFGGEERLYAKLLGRRRDGTPLIEGGQGLNDFTYEAEPYGAQCPYTAHIRRANPRAKDEQSVHGTRSRTPRILRRGFSFGPHLLEGQRASSDDPQRGLMFMAYNASIAEQFEVIQRWINGGNSTGILSSHSDPLVSCRHDQFIRILDRDKVHTLRKKRPFVTLKWGAYFFSPSHTALRRLAGLPPAQGAYTASGHPSQEDELADRGEKIIAQLQKLERAEPERAEGVDAAETQWKVVLEDIFARDVALSVWAAIRRRGGVLRTRYGVLVGSAELVQQVMSDETKFSVRTYFQRMSESVGALYLGMDRCPVRMPDNRSPDGADDRYEECMQARPYEQASQHPNRFMSGLTISDAFVKTRASAHTVLGELREIATARAEEGATQVIDLRDYAAHTVSRVSKYWFGLPDPPDFPESPAGYSKFQTAAQYIFYPHPEPSVAGAARGIHDQLQEIERIALGSRSVMASELPRQDEAKIARALVGGTQGFVAATAGSFLSVANQWLENEHGTFWRLRQWLHSDEGIELLADAAPAEKQLKGSLLYREMLEAMANHPVPDILHRKAVGETRWKTKSGTVTIAPGETVVVSLGSAIQSDPARDPGILFGGTNYKPGAVHACPGKEAALGVMLGMLVELLRQTGLQHQGPLLVTLPALASMGRAGR